MQEATMSTIVVLLGLTIVGLIVQTLNQIRLIRILRRVETLEAKILARLLMMETKEQATMAREKKALEMMTLEGTPVTLEDLIQRDLMEQMGETSPMTDHQVKEMVREITDMDTVDLKETPMEPTKTVRRDVRVMHPDGTSKVYPK